MKKIALYIDSEYNQGGVFQYTKTLIYVLDSLHFIDIKFTFLYTKKSWEEYLKLFTGIESIYIKKSILTNTFYQFMISIGLRSIIKTYAINYDKEIRYLDMCNFDFVIFPGGDTIASLCDSNVVCIIHDLMHRYERRFKESGGFFRFRYRENFYRSILSTAAAVFVDSELGVKHVKESFPKVKSKIFILPYIAPDYIYSKIFDQYLSSKFNILPASYIFYPAQFWPHKNHINLLKSLKILRDRGEIVNLILSGNKNREYLNLKKFVEKNGLVEQVKFMGQIPDLELVYLYKNALALVMPTYFGPTNIPPIEAILLGCPPIVSNIYAMHDQLENASLYFDPEDPNDIAEQIFIIRKSAEIRNLLIKNGESIRKKFSQERFKDDVKIIFSELCDLEQEL